MGAHVLVVGSYNVGFYTFGGAIPAPGQTLMADRFMQIAGGKGSNQALASARLGAPTRFLARVGNDDFGRQALALHAACGVPTGSIIVDPSTHTGVGLVIVDAQGGNAISVAPGANGRLSPEDCLAHEALFAQADSVLLQLETPLPTVRAAKALALKHGVRVVLNPAPAVAVEDELFAGIDICTPNEHEAAQVTGIATATIDGAAAAGRALRAKGVRRVLITLGARGSLLVDDEGSWHCPPCQVTAIDSSGAGDAYNGALCADLLAGASLREAVRTATRVAAHCVMHEGVVEGLPTRAQLAAIPQPRT
jgi:ribokinase